MKGKELKRQMVHLGGTFTVPLILLYGKFYIGILAFLFSLFILILSEYYKKREEIKDRIPFKIKFLERLEDIFYDAINSLEREKYIKKHPYFGAFTFYLMVGTVLFIFPLKIACLAITVLAVGDSSATLIGTFMGRHNLPGNLSKTWEGTLGGFLASIVACSILSIYINIPASYIFISSGVGIFAEAFSGKINDNITIPISVGLILSLIGIL